MRNYELTALFPGSLAEKQLEKEIKDLVTLLEKSGAKIKEKRDPEKKSMAYEIKHVREAYYVFLELSMEPALVTEIESKLRVADNIIRYLLVKAE